MNPGRTPDQYLALGQLEKLNIRKKDFYYIGISTSSVVVLVQNDHIEDYFEHSLEELFYYSDVMNFDTRTYATV